MTDDDLDTLRGDCGLLADQLRSHMRDFHQFARNHCRYGNALIDAVQFIRQGQYKDAKDVCLHALQDAAATAYENDYDTDEWTERFLGEED